ncbi:hypothetical protein HZC00_03870 [Candidatus Kaiserbacteria bacterium]|nr:hypothetical protein [Candidatus Kaiserbacteria bacterium]
MEAILVLLAFPLAWPFIAKRIWGTEINLTEMAINIIVICLLSLGVWELGKYGQVADTEIWNGAVTRKDRTHGYYVTSYSCNCRQTCSGSGKNRTCTQTCDTCYQDHYTVAWTADTTVGNVTFQKLDRSYRSVYQTPDPEVYTRCKVGEPAAIEHGYTNYIQAVPQSLFSGDKEAVSTWALPTYPRVYDFYRIRRVLNIDTKIANVAIDEINNALNAALKDLGQEKQVNVIVILTETDDPAYRYSVEKKWIGGKKNDVVVFVGLDGDVITWADTMTWALNKGNELFHVKLRDAVKGLKTLDPKTFVPSVISTIEQHYDRPEMKQFEYLKEEIKPPLWVMVLAIAIATLGSIGLSQVFRVYEVEDFIGGLLTFNSRKGYER